MNYLLTWVLQRLKLPWLFIGSAVLLVVNLFVPDPLPFVDEALLALLTAVLGSLRKPRKDLEKNESSDQADKR